MPYLDTSDATRLFYADWGAGAPVVMSHSWALNSDMWNYQVPALTAAGRRVVAHDRRGHGRSDVPGRGYDYDTFADDLAAVIEHLDLRAITLVAHSAGGGEAVRYLARHGSERVERLVLIAPTTPFLAAGVPPEALEASAAALGGDVPRWCADNAPGFFGRTTVSEGMRAWVTRQIVDTPLPVLLATAAAFAATDQREEVAAIDVPALVIHGDLDESAPIGVTGRPTAALLPHGDLVVYEGSGHGLYCADHERVNADLLAFIGADRAVAA